MGETRVPDSASNGNRTVVAGASGATLNRKLVLVLSIPFETVTKMTVLPTWPRAGSTLTVLFVADPPNRMLPCGTRDGFEDLPERRRLDPGNRASPICNGIGPVDVFFAINWPSTEEIERRGKSPGKLVNIMSEGTLSNPLVSYAVTKKKLVTPPNTFVRVTRV